MREQINAIEEVREKWEQSLINGIPSNYENYKYTIGVIKGLNIAIDVIKEQYKHNSEG